MRSFVKIKIGFFLLEECKYLLCNSRENTGQETEFIFIKQVFKE